jgi:hypothetical protein
MEIGLVAEFELPETRKKFFTIRDRPLGVVVSRISAASSSGAAESRPLGDRRKRPIATSYRGPDRGVGG